MASRGLQHFVEETAATPVFFAVVLCVICRSASFWSGGALNIPALLGPIGLRAFDIATGLGISVGSEMLASIFGRQALRYKAEAFEAAGRSGIKRTERVALVKEFTWRYKLSLLFCLLGLGASAAAGFAFLSTTTNAHSLGTDVAELTITLTLVTILAALGIFYEGKRVDTSEIAIAQAQALRGKIVEAAGNRLANGEMAPQDIRLLSRQLPRQEAAKFLGALLPDSPDDPTWRTADLFAWLDISGNPSQKRQIHRRLSKLYEAGTVTKDEKGYAFPRSIAVGEFGQDFIDLHRPGSLRLAALSSTPRGNQTLVVRDVAQVGDDAMTSDRQSGHGNGHGFGRGADNDATVARSRHGGTGGFGSVLGELFDLGKTALASHVAEAGEAAE